MGKTRYKRACEFLEIIKAKYGKTIMLETLIKEAKIYLGDDEIRTLKPYVKMMIEYELIKEGENGICIE